MAPQEQLAFLELEGLRFAASLASLEARPLGGDDGGGGGADGGDGGGEGSAGDTGGVRRAARLDGPPLALLVEGDAAASLASAVQHLIWLELRSLGATAGGCPAAAAPWEPPLGALRWVARTAAAAVLLGAAAACVCAAKRLRRGVRSGAPRDTGPRVVTTELV